MRHWQQTVGGGALALLALAALGPQRSRAEIDFNGGFVITNMSRPAAPPPPRRSEYPASAQPLQFGYLRPARSYRPIEPTPPAVTTGNPNAPGAGRAPGRETLSPALYGVSTAALPWEQAGFEGPAAEPARPAHYSLASVPLPHRNTRANAGVAVLIAHLPADANLWVEGKRTRSTGRTRYFESPPLEPGAKYAYTLRAAWSENGQRVTQTRKIAVRAGQVYGVYLTPSPGAVARQHLHSLPQKQN